jgi:hypothetical protein
VVISIVGEESRLRGSNWLSLSTLTGRCFETEVYDFRDHLELTSTLMSEVMAAFVPDSDSLQ